MSLPAGVVGLIVRIVIVADPNIGFANLAILVARDFIRKPRRPDRAHEVSAPGPRRAATGALAYRISSRHPGASPSAQPGRLDPRAHDPSSPPK